MAALAYLGTRANADAATAASERILADPAATREDRIAALEREEAAIEAYAMRPGAEAELEAGI